VIVERGLGGNDADLAHRLESFRRDRSRRAGDMRKLAAGWARMAAQVVRCQSLARARLRTCRSHACWRSPFRSGIGKARGAPASSSSPTAAVANLDATHPLARSPFLVAAELSGTAASTRILLAAARR
jgi:ATP-dependent helicase HrpB